MWKKFVKWFKGLFSKNFIVPVVNERLATAVDDKLKAHGKQTQKEMDKYTQIMADYLQTFFSRKYKSDLDSQLAFDTINRDWKKLCRDVNSTNKHLSLNKNEFERQVKIHLEKQKNKQQQQPAV